MSRANGFIAMVAACGLALVGSLAIEARASDGTRIEGIHLFHFHRAARAGEATPQRKSESGLGSDGLGGLHAQEPGARPLVQGNLSATALEAAAVRKLSARVAARTSVTRGTLVITVRWGTAVPTATPTQARDFVFGTQATSTANWIREASFGRIALQGTVTRVLTIADPGACESGSGPFLGLIAERAEAAAASAGFRLASYPLRIINTPISQLCGARGWGMADGRTWIGNGLYEQASLYERYLVAHELGHSFGLDHSHGLECGAVIFSEVCLGIAEPSNVEYGDPFDTMGSSHRLNGLAMYNAQQLARIGWLPRVTQPVTTGGKYTISPLEATKSEYAPALTINTRTRGYTVEFRQALGLDSFMGAVSPSPAGVLVHMRNDLPSADSGSLLLDTTPGSRTCPDGSGECDFYDAALAIGRTFTDLDKLFVLKVVSIGAHSATVEVTFGGGSGSDTG